jgi:acyl dehydratase
VICKKLAGSPWDNSEVTDRRPRYFDDYQPGITYDCGSVSVSEDEIVSFAKDFDPQPFHVDPVAAPSGPFRGLIAAGGKRGAW